MIIYKTYILEQEKKRQYYEELFKNLNDDTNEDNENTKL